MDGWHRLLAAVVGGYGPSESDEQELRDLCSVRVVYRDGEREVVLGELPLAFRSPRSLDPFISRLLADGKQHGQVALLDMDTGDEIVARAIRPFKQGNRNRSVRAA